MHTQILDLWTLPVAPQATDLALDELRIEVEDFPPQPLDHNYRGRATQDTVPEDLQPTLLAGQASLYAVLDACKIDDLPEVLAASGLEHSCLFEGDTLEALGDQAPWLVRLSADSALLSQLFTIGPAPWHLGGRPLGIFIRSLGTLADLRRHLRKFTHHSRAKEDGTRGALFRFYEPAALDAYLSEAPAPALHGLFHGPEGRIIEHFVLQVSPGLWRSASLKGAPDKAPRSSRLDPPTVERVALRSAARRIEARLRAGQKLDFGALEQPKVEAVLMETLTSCHAAGLRHELYLTHLLGWAISIGPEFWRDLPDANAAMKDQEASAQSRFLRIQEAVKAAYPDKVVSHYV